MSTIEWTDETWNPTVGCSRVSPGCDRCYAVRVAAREMQDAHRGLTKDGDWTGEVRCLPERLETPLRWRKPRRVFVDSMSDLFHPDVPDEFIARVFGVCGAAERHTFQILTKRPQRMAALLSSPGFVREVQKRWWVKWYGVVDVPDPMPTRRAGDPESRPLRVDKSRARRLLWKPGRTSFPLGSQDLPFPLPNVWLGGLRNNTEHSIFASRGKPRVPVEKPLSTWFEWARGAHSRKPAAFYDLVEQVSPGPYLELFARQPRLGWDSWGYGYETTRVIGDSCEA